MQDALRLSELMCARLCHDLSGSVGSLVGMTEFATDASPGSETASVAAEAAAVLAGRVRLLRAAWAGDSAPMDVDQMRSLVACIGAGRRVEIDLSGIADGGVLCPAEARVLLNVLLLGIEGLGGAGHLAAIGAAGDDIVVTIAGPRAAWPAGLARYFVDESAAWGALRNARSLQGPLTALIAHRAGLRLSLLVPAGAAGITQPAPLLISPAPRRPH